MVTRRKRKKLSSRKKSFVKQQEKQLRRRWLLQDKEEDVTDRESPEDQELLREVSVECCIMYVISVPEDWTSDDIEYGYNVNRRSSDMVEQLIQDLRTLVDSDNHPSSCLKWRYLREVEEGEIELAKEQGTIFP